MKEVGELATTGHKEADTRLAIHAMHAASNHPTVIVVSEDTAIFCDSTQNAFQNRQTDTIENRKEKSD